MNRYEHGHNNIGIAINEHGVSLLLPAMIAFTRPEEFVEFVDAITNAMTQAFSELGMNFNSDNSTMFTRDDYEQIMSDVEQYEREWTKKILPE